MRSALGQPLRASIGLLGTDSGELTGSCVKVRIETLDGVSLATPQLIIARNGPASFITLTSRQAIFEPAATIVVEVSCTSSVRRIYHVLLDPPVLTGLAQLAPAPLRESRVSPASSSAREQPEPVERKSFAQAVRPPRVKRRQASESVVKKPVAPQFSADAKPNHSQGAAIDVLRLTGNEDSGVSRLKLSSSLIFSTDAAASPWSEETRLAQLEFAAILRDQEPRTGSSALNNKAAQAQETSLRAQMAALQRQNGENQAALAALQSSSSLLIWLSGLLVLCLLAIGWLAWRLRSLIRSDNAAWWTINQLDNAKQDAAQSASVEPIVSARSPLTSAAALPSVKNTESLQPDVGPDIGTALDVPVVQNAPDADVGFVLPEYVGSVGKEKRESANDFNVEVISDVMQEAEFWISLNDPRRAIGILEPHTAIDYPDSPVTWLYLLDLYREVGDEEKYNALRERFTRLFNARIPLYGEPELTSQSLEDFPHLLDRICKLWRTVDIVPFLQSLLIDDRAGARAGFDLPLYRDILLLIGIALEKKRLNQLEESHSEMRETASQVSEEIALPSIEAFVPVAATFTTDGAIEFEPLEFNFTIDDEQKPDK
ncbi:MAG: hypothetical protein ABIO19_10150 [Burkholderiaceae bacterium]